MSVARRFILGTVCGLWALTAFAAEPPFTITDDGTAFLYRARPGDHPGTLGEMFGIAPDAMPAFLAANGISDPSLVPVGHVFRIPNPFLTRAERAERRADAAEYDLAGARARVGALEAELTAAHATATRARERADGLERFAWLWRVGLTLAALFVLAAGVAFAVATGAVRSRRRAEQYARTLADELEDKRRRGLSERQESAKRILDLEAQVQALAAARDPLSAVPRRTTATGR